MSNNLYEYTLVARCIANFPTLSISLFLCGNRIRPSIVRFHWPTYTYTIYSSYIWLRYAYWQSGVHLTLNSNTSDCSICYNILSISNLFSAFRLEVMGKGGPPPAEKMKQERNRKLIQKEAKQAFTRLLLHIFFAAVLYCMSYINRDQRGFLCKDHIGKHLYTSSKYQYGFSKVIFVIV